MVGALVTVWLVLLIAAAGNALWLFKVLVNSGLQFREADKAALDSEETGRILAGLLAQPGFLLIFALGLLIGPFCAWLLMQQSKGLAAKATHLRFAAVLLLLASFFGGLQLILVRMLADHAVERTSALMSHDQSKADQAKASLDYVHHFGENFYIAECVCVVFAMLMIVRPGPRRDWHEVVQ